jgi:hypothetical protein
MTTTEKNKKLAELEAMVSRLDPIWVEERLALQGMYARIEQLKKEECDDSGEESGLA